MPEEVNINLGDKYIFLKLFDLVIKTKYLLPFKIFLSSSMPESSKTTKL